MSKTVPAIGDADRRARLGRRQLLAPSGRAARVEDVADAVVGLHATDAATVYLSACARLAAPSAAVDRALYGDVSLVKLLSMRRTIFAVTEGFAPSGGGRAGGGGGGGAVGGLVGGGAGDAAVPYAAGAGAGREGLAHRVGR